MLLPSIFERDFADDLFENVFSGPFGFDRNENSKMKMKSDLKEFDDKYELNLQLPGFKKEDINAELKDGYLTVSAAHQESNDKSDKDGNYVWKESFSGQYARSFYVGKEMKQEDIKAKFDNGELRFEIPKTEPQKGIEEKKTISIE